MVLKKCIMSSNTMLTENYNFPITNGQPVGIVVHSTASNRTDLWRYVQPDEDASDREEILADIGENKYGTAWNRANVGAGVHAFIGTNLKGEVEVYQTLPYDICAGGVYRGVNGSWNYNPTAHLQFEVCESGQLIDFSASEENKEKQKELFAKLEAAQGLMEIDPITDIWTTPPDEEYSMAAFETAIEYCAYLCKEFNLKSEDVKSHFECYCAGYGSGHADIEHWLAYFGLTMTWFRSKVAELLPSEKTDKEMLAEYSVKLAEVQSELELTKLKLEKVTEEAAKVTAKLTAFYAAVDALKT